jgi:hypothetical protein
MEVVKNAYADEQPQVENAQVESAPKENTDDKGRTKLSYEELVNIANQLHQQNQEIRQKLNGQEFNQFVVRINFLFEVLKNAQYFGIDFVKKVAYEIGESIYPTQQPTDAAPEGVEESVKQA